MSGHDVIRRHLARVCFNSAYCWHCFTILVICAKPAMYAAMKLVGFVIFSSLVSCGCCASFRAELSDHYATVKTPLVDRSINNMRSHSLHNENQIGDVNTPLKRRKTSILTILLGLQIIISLKRLSKFDENPSASLSENPS